ncbi:uncharacterized protein LOC134257349 isoform X2 [Saccostrea cucullata]|uniref:uncharacterized protein LOC134257349 isoform X2 n=1 Tax=Saccostrea cuccullata TaxID=36930 RepID=UPI002ED00858
MALNLTILQIRSLRLLFFFFWISSGAATTFRNGESLGTVSREISHASGLAASRKHHGVLYTHNNGVDHRPFIYAINASTASLIARLRVYPANNHDWEDIAVGPCGKASCIYIEENPNVVYRVEEPDFIYSDQILPLKDKVQTNWQHDHSNTLMVDPSGLVYVVAAHHGGTGKIGRINPGDWGRTNVNIDTDIKLHVPTHNVHHHNADPVSGDISKDGRQILILMKDHVYYWNVINGDILQTLGSSHGRETLPLKRRNSEAIAWDSSGRNYYTVERGESVPLYLYQREDTSPQNIFG